MNESQIIFTRQLATGHMFVYGIRKNIYLCITVVDVMCSSLKSVSLYLCNCIGLNVLVGTLVVFYWQATWSLLDLYVFPNKKEVSAAISLSVGFFCHLLNISSQKFAHDHLVKKSSKAFVLLSRLHTYAIALGCVCSWRGIWNSIDMYTGINITSAILCSVVPVVLLVCLKALQSINSPPFVIALDIDRNQYFRIKTRFDIPVSLSWKFVGDAIFTVVIIYSLVVVFWRGTWTFLDVIFTTDPKKKILWTFCVYVGIQVMLSLLHYPKRKFANIVERKSFILKYILENIVTSFMGIASVSFWKAIWNFLSIYYIPEHKHLAAWSAHAIGYVGLVLCLSCKSVPPPGFSKDGDLENGEISSQTLDAVQRLNKFCASLPKGKSKTECRETVEVVITEITHL